MDKLKDYKERIANEKKELDERLNKLIKFFSDDKFNSIPTDEQERMKRQADHMTNYSVVLGERIAAF